MKAGIFWKMLFFATFVLWAVSCSSGDENKGDSGQEDASADGVASEGSLGPGIRIDQASVGDVQLDLQETASAKSPLQGDPCTPPTSRVVINQLMVNPAAVSDAYGQWIELYNPGASDIDIGGWVLKDTGTNNHVIQRSLVVPSGGYVVLCRNADPSLNGGVTCGYEYSDTVLTNSGDAVILFDDQGTEVDRVEYTGDAPSGMSISLRHPYLDNSTLAIPPKPQTLLPGTDSISGYPPRSSEKGSRARQGRRMPMFIR